MLHSLQAAVISARTRAAILPVPCHCGTRNYALLRVSVVNQEEGLHHRGTETTERERRYRRAGTTGFREGPAGTTDNSPPFQRWVARLVGPKPRRGDRKGASRGSSFVPAGTRFVFLFPSDKSLGYCLSPSGLGIPLTANRGKIESGRWRKRK